MDDGYLGDASDGLMTRSAAYLFEQAQHRTDGCRYSFRCGICRWWWACVQGREGMQQVLAAVPCTWPLCLREGTVVPCARLGCSQSALQLSRLL